MNTVFQWLNDTYSLKHFDGGNFLFMDGHVKFRKQDSISAREFGIDYDRKGVEPGVSDSGSVGRLPEAWAR